MYIKSVVTQSVKEAVLYCNRAADTQKMYSVSIRRHQSVTALRTLYAVSFYAEILAPREGDKHKSCGGMNRNVKYGNIFAVFKGYGGIFKLIIITCPSV